MRDKKGFSYGCFRAVRGFVRLIYPKTKIENLDNLPDEPCVVVANHCQLNGPIIGELYFPENKTIWCAGGLVHLKEAPDFIYNDFFKFKPQRLKWLWRIASYILAPLFPFFFSNADTIAVYHDGRILYTFRQTVDALAQGKRVVIFPESFEGYNNIVNRFHDGFADIGRMYYRRTGKPLAFVPMYIAPKLKSAYIEKPIYYDPTLPTREERARICSYLTDTIVQKAVSLPRHKVVPHDNISSKNYPYNIEDREVIKNA